MNLSSVEGLMSYCFKQSPCFSLTHLLRFIQSLTEMPEFVCSSEAAGWLCCRTLGDLSWEKSVVISCLWPPESKAAFVRRCWSDNPSRRSAAVWLDTISTWFAAHLKRCTHSSTLLHSFTCVCTSFGRTFTWKPDLAAAVIFPMEGEHN